MIKIEADVLLCEDFKYGEKKDKNAAVLWLGGLSGDPRPAKFTVFGDAAVAKAHAYASAKKAVFTVGVDGQLNIRLNLL